MIRNLVAVEILALAAIVAGDSAEKIAVLADRPHTRGRLHAAGLIEGEADENPGALRLTAKGEVLMAAMLALPMPEKTGEWRMPS